MLFLNLLLKALILRLFTTMRMASRLPRKFYLPSRVNSSGLSRKTGAPAFSQVNRIGL